MVFFGSFLLLFVHNQRPRLDTMRFVGNMLPSWLPNEIKDVQELAAQSIAQKIIREPVEYQSNSVDELKIMVNTSFTCFPASMNAKLQQSDKSASIPPTSSFFSQFFSVNSKIKSSRKSKRGLAPLVLVHGFDSSCFEFRRIAPLLNERRDVYAIDILGWGFNDHSGVKDFSPAAKINHLREFIKTKIDGPCILVGASLGGAIAIILAVDSPELVEKVVLIDAQGFIDGKEKTDTPDFLA
eukprot:gene43521-57945_t